MTLQQGRWKYGRARTAAGAAAMMPPWLRPLASLWLRLVENPSKLALTLSGSARRRAVLAAVAAGNRHGTVAGIPTSSANKAFSVLKLPGLHWRVAGGG